MKIESSTSSNSNKTGDSEKQRSSSYLYYYSSTLLGNAGLVSCFSVQTFLNSDPCLDSKGNNITLWFDACFTAGFIIHVVNFSFFAFLEPYQRSMQINSNGKPMGMYQTMYTLFAYIFEILIRLLIYIASILYIILLLSRQSKYCVNDIGTLKVEGTWLLVLTVFQIVLNTVSLIWRIKIVRADHLKA